MEATRAALAAEAINAEAVLTLTIEKLRRELYGQRQPLNRKSERNAREGVALSLSTLADQVAELEARLRLDRARPSRHAPLAKATDYLPKRWPHFTRSLEDGRIRLTNNAAERALRGIALGRQAWLFVGSGRGGQRAAFMYGLIVTA